MNDDEKNDAQDPMARLRAADPAAGIEPRAGFAEDTIAAATGAGSTAGSGADAGAAAPVTELGAERAKRRPRWLPIAAVAASMLVLGGGAGYAVAALGGQGSGSTLAGAPPISLSNGSGGAQEGAQGQVGAGQPGVAQDKAMAGSGAYDSMPWGWGRNHFTSSGLSTDAGSAAGYAFDPGSAANAETIGALAAALGVQGEPVLKDGSWSVGSQDGTAPSLWVNLDGALSFWYSNPAVSPWSCMKEDGSDCTPTGTPPSEETAIAALRSVLTATGRDADAFAYDSEIWDGAITRTAQAWPIVDGQRIDQAWSIELAEEGTVSISGALAPIVGLGEYPVVSADEAFGRLSDPRFGAQRTGDVIALRADDTTGAETWVPPTAPPATPGEGAAVSWPVTEVHIVEARLGLASQWQADGSVLIVPAYEFTDADGGTWSVIAVAEDALDFATE
ncbi:hypothetical protein ROT00_00105 [Agromyces mediolanus]|uniref:hypothetical protein n=1 Tax=Agromyces mediolanus TaxID=41986 RepID=UPI0038388B51